jgi:hypothetical protein
MSSRFVEGTTKLLGRAQPKVSGLFPDDSWIYICVWPSQPAPGASLDCRTGSPKPAALVVPANQKDPNGNTYALADDDGKFTAQLSTPLTAGQFVSAVEASTNAAKIEVSAFSNVPIGVKPSSQCNKNFATQPFSDCDLSLSLIGVLRNPPKALHKVPLRLS